MLQTFQFHAVGIIAKERTKSKESSSYTIPKKIIQQKKKLSSAGKLLEQ